MQARSLEQIQGQLRPRRIAPPLPSEGVPVFAAPVATSAHSRAMLPHHCIITIDEGPPSSRHSP